MSCCSTFCFKLDFEFDILNKTYRSWPSRRLIIIFLGAIRDDAVKSSHDGFLCLGLLFLGFGSRGRCYRSCFGSVVVGYWRDGGERIGSGLFKG